MNKKALLAIVGIVVLSSAGIAYGAAQMIITMSAGQTENPLVIEDSAGNDLFVIDRFGNINGLKTAYVTKTSAYTATSADDTIVVDASSASVTITLPPAASNTGKIFTVLKSDTSTNSVTVDANGAETINGQADFRITHTLDHVKIQSDGTGWKILSQSSSDSPSAFAIRGTTADRWFGSAIVNYLLTSTFSPSTTNLQAFPFIVAKTITLDKIQIEVFTASGSNTCRMGIYTDDGNTYPSTLVSGSDVGTVDVGSTGVKTNTFASPITLPGDSLYWLALECSGGTPAVRAFSAGTTPNVLGSPATMGGVQTAVGWSVANAYDAFPSTYPAGGTPITTSAIVPQILVRITG